jgi:hypothetical protein
MSLREDSLEYRLGYERGWRQGREEMIEQSEPVDFGLLEQLFTDGAL